MTSPLRHVLHPCPPHANSVHHSHPSHGLSAHPRYQVCRSFLRYSPWRLIHFAYRTINISRRSPAVTWAVIVMYILISAVGPPVSPIGPFETDALFCICRGSASSIYGIAFVSTTRIFVAIPFPDRPPNVAVQARVSLLTVVSRCPSSRFSALFCSTKSKSCSLLSFARALTRHIAVRQVMRA